ncbi:MAG TPA: DivIVA domain-containing protein [Actinophytocola sp.]|nr:DivIVA domain-containing protein [Actinophytocola sp.]
MGNDSPLLSADAVENARFDPARFPSRGYNEDQVDDFLDLVVHTIRVLTATLDQQRQEIDRLKHWRQNTGPVDNAAAAAWEQEARARADAIVAAARVSAEEIRRLAVSNAQRVVHTDHLATVVEVVDRLHMLRDGITAELGRLEDALSAGQH